jgi:16S rRNA (guanine527-N7)-methyltransferase
MADAPLEHSRVGASLRAAGIAISAEELRLLTDYLNLLVKWNRVYNLTGIREADELVGRHLVESLALAPLLRGSRIIDVGTGAGLPGIPLAVVRPDAHLVLVESRAKRVRFLRHVAGTLRLRNVEVRQARVEALRDEKPFDTVLARAVAPPAELIELTAHLMAPGSLLLMLTAARLEAEWRAIAERHHLRVLAPETAPTALRSSIVVLERTHE